MPIKSEIQAHHDYSGLREPSLIKYQRHYLEAPTEEARFAMTIMERWAMVSSQEDGEDSAGRQKLKLLSEEDIVKRACNISSMAFDAFRRLDWLTPVPTLEELEADIQSRKKKRENGENE